ncbi:MAG: class II fructose-bisphosphate aldolase [Roseiflexaceae bacterium]|nr:class II fructose-bisphosphate aldolase [Roseiflexaceae bacterium]
MRVSMLPLLQAAQAGGYAIGAFNVYNLEGVQAVVAAAEAERSPAILQIHPGALAYGGQLLIALCLAAADQATIPVAVHLDHAATSESIRAALDAGVPSIMADGSQHSYDQNLAFTRSMVDLAHTYGATVEAELGRLSGSEDGLTIPEYQALLTDPNQAADFVAETGIDALAVCIGNVHGRYRGEPQLDFERLSAIHAAVAVPLVLHGASGLPAPLVEHAIELGICKLNVNTEMRAAYLASLQATVSQAKTPDLTDLMGRAVAAMQEVVVAKLRLFRSDGTVRSIYRV